MKEMDFVDFWANKCKNNMRECQKEVNKLVDAQIQIGNHFYKKIGRKKALKLINK